MAELLTLVQQYIGPVEPPKHLNLYTALGLEPLTDDIPTIGNAVEVAITRLKAADKNRDPKSFEEVVKIVRQARSTLLDGEKKAVYDKQLKSVLRRVAPEVLGNESQALTESARLREVLPDGDPTAPFSLTDFLKSRPQDMEYETVAERLEALRPLLVGAGYPPSMAASSAALSMPTHSSGSLSGIAESEVDDDYFPLELSNSLSPSPGQSIPAKSTGGAALLRAEIKRKRQKQNLLLLGGVVGAATLLLSFGLWMYLSSVRARSIADAKIAEQKLAPENEGLDSTSGRSITADASKQTKDSKKNRIKVGKVDPSLQDATTLKPLPKVGEAASDESPSGVANAMPNSMEGGNATTGSADQPPVDTGAKNKMPEVPATDPMQAEMQNNIEPWSVAMNEAMQSIQRREFESFNSAIERANALSVDESRTGDYRKLNLVGQLVQMSEESFATGYKKLRPTNTLTLNRATKVNIVEVDDKKLIARVRGSNERFEKEMLPVEWVLAVADVTLTMSPIDDAVRGILLQWHPRATKESRAASEYYFKKAATADKRFEGIDTVFERQFGK